MDFALSKLVQQPAAVLLVGSALLAAGASIVLGLALYWLRCRNRARGAGHGDAAQSAAVDPSRVDVVDLAGPPQPVGAVDFAAVDLCLDDVDAQLERLHVRIAALVRQRETKSGVRTASSLCANSVPGSEEEKALREMVARNL